MSKFNGYAKKVDEIAKNAFGEYRKAEQNLKAAEGKIKEYPYRNAASPEYAAKYARAQADLYEAQKAYKDAKTAFEGHERDIAALRKELEAELDNNFSADPAAIDNNTLALMKSGILNSREYKKLMDSAKSAGNHTMARLIAQAAAEEAANEEKRNGQNSPTARELRQVAYMAREVNGKDYLRTFDAFADVYHRATRNDAMIDRWDSLCGELIENF